MVDLGESHFSRDEKSRLCWILCWIVSTGDNDCMNLTVKRNQVLNSKRDKIFCDGLFRLETQSAFNQNGRGK